jgi:glutathione S-transferase
MKLYYYPRTRATRPRWMFEELGVPYEMANVDLMKGEQKLPDYMKIVHPLGRVPALEENGFMMFESAAIVMQLADRYPEKGLAPAVGTNERAEYYQWIFCAMTEAEPPLVTMLMHTMFLPEAERSPAAIEMAVKRFKPVADVIAGRMKDRQYILGDKFTAADIVMGGVLAFAGHLKQLEGHPVLQEYLKRLMERPAAKKVFG